MKNHVVKNLGIKVKMMVSEACRQLYRHIPYYEMSDDLYTDDDRVEALVTMMEYDDKFANGEWSILHNGRRYDNCEMYYEITDTDFGWHIEVWVKVLVDIVKKSTIVSTILSIIEDVRSILSANIIEFGNGSEMMIEDDSTMWYVGVPLK